MKHTETSKNSWLNTVSLTNKEGKIWVGLLDAGIILCNELPRLEFTTF
jgi:hypothetical protein